MCRNFKCRERERNMDRNKIEIGTGILSEVLNSVGDYILVSMEEPLKLFEKSVKNKPKAIILNQDMRIDNLERIENSKKINVRYIVGFGGGSSCDTAKYLSWKWNIPLIISPSIVSVDAWLCRSIAVRVNHRVEYIGDVQAERFIVDTSLIKKAPKFLNWAGIADIISITTALGDWNIARNNFGVKHDQKTHDQAKKIAEQLLLQAENIRKVNDEGILALVNGQVDEVVLCEEWGDSRPEEGGEHFLAYCLEEITHEHYIHGNLIALNVLIVLKLQKESAAFDYNEIKRFFDKIDIQYSPKNQGIEREMLEKALSTVQEYVKAEKLRLGLWSLDVVFDTEGEYSIKGILDWIYSWS